MNLKKIDHVGIAVNDLTHAEAVWRDALGFREVRRETIASEGVRVVCLEANGHHVELLEALGPDSPVAKFLAKRGEGIHHIAVAVDDLESHVAHLKAQGVALINEEPRTGVGGNRIVFVHPKSTNGVLVELTEKGSDHG